MAIQSLAAYKSDFLQAAINGGSLTFGSFELKSKRISPYFFNAGNFFRADLLKAIATAYATAIIEAREQDGLTFDIVFGPAYKGIPLATSTTAVLAELDPINYSQLCYSFDRKEAKDHGEGGNIVGAPLKGKRVLLVDDVVTDGKAKREAIDKIRNEGGSVVGIVVALDRMETLHSPDGDDRKASSSAIGALRKEYGIPILTILTLDDIINGMKSFASADDVKRTEEYRTKYKARD
jgi:orotate phosphoribosyltransferase